MAAYAVTDVCTVSADSVEKVATLLETALEAIVDTKTLYYVDIIELENQRRYVGVIIHTA